MSGIDFSKLTAPNGAAPAAAGNNADREKAQFWVNIGFEAVLKTGEGKEAVEETRFIALPGGIPVDSLKPVPTGSTNVLYAKQQASRNALLEAVQAQCAMLQPGEEKFLNLRIQLRRVNDERPEPDAETNEILAQMPSIV